MLSKAGNQQWAVPMAALTSGLRNLGLSQFAAKELFALENELQVRAGAASACACMCVCKGGVSISPGAVGTYAYSASVLK